MPWYPAKLMVSTGEVVVGEYGDSVQYPFTVTFSELPAVPDKKTLIREAGETLESMKEVKDAHVQD